MRFISYYKLMQEMAEEEGFSFNNGCSGMDDVQFKSYRNAHKEHFKNILKQCGLYEEYFDSTNKEYHIPVKRKEAFKYLLKHETLPILRKVKKRLKTPLNIDDLVDMEQIKADLQLVIEDRLQNYFSQLNEGIDRQVTEAIGHIETKVISHKPNMALFASVEQQQACVRRLTKNIFETIQHRLKHPVTYEDVDQLIQPLLYNGARHCSEEKEKKMREMLCFCYQLETRAAAEAAIDAMKGLMERDIGHMVASEIHHNRKTAFINDADAASLVCWYFKMMKEQSLRWNKLFDIVADLRREEFCRKAEQGERFSFDGSGDIVVQAYNTLLEEEGVAEDKKLVALNKSEVIPEEKRAAIIEAIAGINKEKNKMP